MRRSPIRFGHIVCKKLPYILVVGDKEKQAKQYPCAREVARIWGDALSEFASVSRLER